MEKDNQTIPNHGPCKSNPEYNIQKLVVKANSLKRITSKFPLFFLLFGCRDEAKHGLWVWRAMAPLKIFFFKEY